MFLASLLEIRAECLNLCVSLCRILLQPANHTHEVALLAFGLLNALLQSLHLHS